MRKEIVYTISKEENGLELKAVLSHSLGFSRHEISRLKFVENGIVVNGKNEKVNYICTTNDVIRLLFPEKEIKNINVVYTPEILYEDEDLVIVNKPAGIPVHASHGHLEDSLGTALVSYYQKQDENFTVRAIGRLDKDVSGGMLYAKNQPAAARLSRQRKDGVFQKTYIAFVEGTFEKKQGTLHILLEKDKENKKQKVGSGKECVTKYRVLRNYKEFSALEIQLETGRTHQIRACFSSIGHPLLGDKLYNGNNEYIDRPALHCGRVECVSPFSSKRIDIEIPLPEDLKKLI